VKLRKSFRGRIGEIEHGEIDLLLAELTGEARQNRGVFVPEGDERYQQKALQVSGEFREFSWIFQQFSPFRLVEIAMEAMDLLLMACHAQTLNLFVESFLKMVQKLLEDSNPNLQIMATNSVRIPFSWNPNNPPINFLFSPSCSS
jgi:hypothetical protein